MKIILGQNNIAYIHSIMYNTEYLEYSFNTSEAT